MNALKSGNNLLIFSGVRGDTRRYRTLHLYEQVCLAGVDCTLSHLMDRRLPGLLEGVSAAVIHRVSADGYVETLLDRLRRQNTLVVLDADDFLYDPQIMRWIDSPDFQDPVRAGLYRQEILRHRRTLERCDAVTVSTGFLAGLMEPFGLPVRVHRNAFSLEMLALSREAAQKRVRKADRVVLGYASGTRTHDRDFALIRPALCEVLGRNPQAELWLMGDVDPGGSWGSLQGRIRTFPRVSWRELPARLAMLDINLAPLVPESPFNQAKSEIKYMEAALVGVPTVASRTDAFSFAIRSGENGFLADRLEDWQSILENLVADAPAREAPGAAAYQQVLEHYAPWVRGPELLRTLADFARLAGKPTPGLPTVAASTPDPGANNRFYFSASDEQRPTLKDMAWYSIRHRGALTLLGQLWVYFRRMLAPVIPYKKPRTV